MLYIISAVFIIPPASKKLKGGYTGFTASVRLSVRLSICPSVRQSVDKKRVCSVSSTILARTISYLHILLSNFRRCVACKGYCDNPWQSMNLWQIFGICNFDFVLFWLWIWYESIEWVIMGRQGVFSERKRSNCSSCIWRDIWSLVINYQILNENHCHSTLIHNNASVSFVLMDLTIDCNLIDVNW